VWFVSVRCKTKNKSNVCLHFNVLMMFDVVCNSLISVFDTDSVRNVSMQFLRMLYDVLHQPPNGWRAADVDRFSTLVLHRRLKAQMVHPYNSQSCTLILFARLPVYCCFHCLNYIVILFIIMSL